MRRWSKATGKRIERLKRSRPDLFGDIAERAAYASLRTMAAVFVRSGGDRWVTLWAFRLLVQESQAALDRDDDDAAMAIAAKTSPDALLQRARAEWPPANIKRSIRIAVPERWDNDKRLKVNLARRQELLWEEPRKPRITIPTSLEWSNGKGGWHNSYDTSVSPQPYTR